MHRAWNIARLTNESRWSQCVDNEIKNVKLTIQRIANETQRTDNEAQRIDNETQRIQIISQCVVNEMQCIDNALRTRCKAFSTENAFALAFLLPGFRK